ncbi:MAG: phosphate acetyltransferase [Calditrichaceae bacterium]
MKNRPAFMVACMDRCLKKRSRIVFTDALDERILRAARFLLDEKLAVPVLLGNPFEIRDFAENAKIRTNGLKILKPLHSAEYDRYVKLYFKLRRHRDITITDAAQYLLDPLQFGAMMLREGQADVCMAGNRTSTADVLRTGYRIIGTGGRQNPVSSFFLMISPDLNRIFAFADCSVSPDPSAEELAETAIQTAASFELVTGMEARVAMLSFSTKGSADHPKTEKVRRAAELALKRDPSLHLDGELQFDAAIVDEIAEKKAPGSVLRGKANVFIFPTLNAANIGYKIAEHLGKYQALGSFIQGFTKPLYDLSRGCSTESIINTSIVASCMNREN